MTTRYTNQEWTAILRKVEEDLHLSREVYKVPAFASPQFAQTIDHTLLKLEATERQIDALCAEARVAGFASVCVRLKHVSRSVANLKSSDVVVACVVGFHEGTQDLYEKIKEAEAAIEAGAAELDIVLNYEVLRSGDYSSTYNELGSLRALAPHPTILKLILETSQLDRGQIVAACCIAAEARFDFVKTSTGFRGHGATEEHVRLMRSIVEKVSPEYGIGVKASGEVRTCEDAVKMMKAGATRIGTSAGVWIVKEARQRVDDARGEETEERPNLQTRLFTDY
ncbi:putative deoxyribose-phosphate aldolase [Cryomyces antarcticus]|uniref:deoxyribose-phosphate aldolase n=1 Tax=Cryomyces antarcticus TaxID=329879 RepID=A0ABR0M7V1_9PEZI|nr:hypothetical protein LTR39_003979 [Cryomyces antarcticus]KAK5013066.1 hypothetical protein LTR60_004061 [Cryomyces antarcticus]KAK5285355.1 hypothetical protein LTR16_004635 [Cryomyces antarcticus]